MILIPERFRKDHFEFVMLKREGSVAMFRKSKSEANTGFEVVIIQKRADYEMGGAVIPAHESMPGNEQWGKQGWTCTSRDAADVRFASLTSHRKAILPVSVKNLSPRKAGGGEMTGEMAFDAAESKRS